jgi:hypothetical protein
MAYDFDRESFDVGSDTEKARSFASAKVESTDLPQTQIVASTRGIAQFA